MLRPSPLHSHGACGHSSLQASDPAQTQASEENWGSFCPWPKGLLPVSSEDRPKRKDGIGGKQPTGLIQSHHFWPDRLVNIYGFVISVELLWFTASLEPAPTSFTFKDGHEHRPRAGRQNRHSSGVIHMREAFGISVSCWKQALEITLLRNWINL